MGETIAIGLTTHCVQGVPDAEDDEVLDDYRQCQARRGAVCAADGCSRPARYSPGGVYPGQYCREHRRAQHPLSFSTTHVNKVGSREQGWQCAQ